MFSAGGSQIAVTACIVRPMDTFVASGNGQSEHLNRKNRTPIIRRHLLWPPAPSPNLSPLRLFCFHFPPTAVRHPPCVAPSAKLTNGAPELGPGFTIRQFAGQNQSLTRPYGPADAGPVFACSLGQTPLAYDGSRLSPELFVLRRVPPEGPNYHACLWKPRTKSHDLQHVFCLCGAMCSNCKKVGVVACSIGQTRHGRSVTSCSLTWRLVVLTPTGTGCSGAVDTTNGDIRTNERFLKCWSGRISSTRYRRVATTFIKQ